MESSAELIKWVLENLNYWVVTIFMTIESSFIPFPSEVIVPPAAWKAMTDDSMNIFLVVLFATIGADLGALINYYLARWLGRPIVYKFANSRLGHVCLIDEEKGHHACYWDSDSHMTYPLNPQHAAFDQFPNQSSLFLKSISENMALHPHSSDASSPRYGSLSVFRPDWQA